MVTDIGGESPNPHLRPTPPTTRSRRRAAAEEAAAARAWRRRRPRRPSARRRRISRCRPTPSARSRKARALPNPSPPPPNPIYLSLLTFSSAPSFRRHRQEPPGPQAVHHPGRRERARPQGTHRTPRSFLASWLSQGFGDFFAVSALLDSCPCLLACRSWSCSAMGPTCTSSSDRSWSSRTSRRPRPTSRSASSTSPQSCESLSAGLICGFISSQCLCVVVLSLWDWLFCRKRMDRALKDLEEKQNSKKESVCYCPLYF